MISADKPVESIQVKEDLIDSDFYKIMRSRRPSPSYERERGFLVIKGFRIKKEFVPAIERPEEIASLAMLLYREGWPVMALSEGSYYRIKPAFPEGTIKEERTGQRNERLSLYAIPPVERPYGPEDFIHTTAKFDSTCTGCGGTIDGKVGDRFGEDILWSPRYKTTKYPKGESFHARCEPGPVEGRKERWEKAAQESAALAAEKMEKEEWEGTWEESEEEE